MNGASLIAAERARQIDIEGWTPEHDDGHDLGEMGLAAWAYAEAAVNIVRGHPELAIKRPAQWPWATSWWKPSPDPVRNLVKAGALIAAEIDRLLRRRNAQHVVPEPPTAKPDGVPDLSTLVERAKGIATWLAESEPSCSSEQRHLNYGSVERAYWHYGYMVALNDAIRFLTGGHWHTPAAPPEPDPRREAICPHCNGTKEIHRTRRTPGGHPIQETDECPSCKSAPLSTP